MKKDIIVIIVTMIIVVSVICTVSCSRSVLSEAEPELVEVIEYEAIKPCANLINNETGETEWSEYKLHYIETTDRIICADYDPSSELFGTIFVSEDNNTVIIPTDWRDCDWPTNTFDHLLQQAGIQWKVMWFYKEPSEITGRDYLLEVIEG